MVYSLFIVQSILLGIFGFFLVYLASLSLLALFGRNRHLPDPSRLRKFAIVVPAHNEEVVIKKTLESLSQIQYPRDLFDVVVVADNCNDYTAQIAQSMDVIVHERIDFVDRGKGYALRWMFDQLLEDPANYDAYCVVDADSVVSENFLDVLNRYLDQGAEALQCSDIVDPQPDAWNVEVTRIGFMLHNYVRPLGRRLIGCPASLYGNGMCFTAKTLQRVPWQAYSVTEDLEYGLTLMLNDINVVFAPEAKVVATMPHQADNAVAQHARWAVGQYPLMRKYTGLLLKRLSIKTIDAWIQLLIPGFVDIISFVLLMLGINLGLWALGIENSNIMIGLWSVALAFGIFHVVAGLFAAGADRLMYKAFIHFPRYAIWKVSVFIKVLHQRHTDKWVRTVREEHPAPETATVASNHTINQLIGEQEDIAIMPNSEELDLDMSTRKSQTILVIDDDVRFLNLMQEVLQSENYTVLKASNGHQGIQLYREYTPNLVFLDLSLPDMSGLLVLKTIREVDEAAKIIVFTAYGSIESAVTAMQEGAVDFVEKLDYMMNFREVMFKKIRIVLDEVNSETDS